MRGARKLCRTCWAIAALVCIARPVQAQETNSPPDADQDDVTRPVTNLDLRYHFEDNTNAAQSDKQSVILRGNFKDDLSANWKLAWRADFLITYANQVTASNPDGVYQSGIGRPLVLAYVADLIDDRQAWAIGDEINGPAISGSQYGSGDWDMLPIVAYRYMLPELGDGSYVVPQLRYSFTFAKAFSATATSNLQFSPQLKIALQDKWFVILFPSTDFRYNFGPKVSGQTGPFFVPLDGEIGRNLGHNLVTSLEVSAPLINDYPLYRLKVELRLSYQL
jgi:hypothetical protein